MYVFKLVIPELSNIGFIVDEVSKMELVVNCPMFNRISRNFECIQLVGSTEIEITQKILLLEHQLLFIIYNTSQPFRLQL